MKHRVLSSMEYISEFKKYINAQLFCSCRFKRSSPAIRQAPAKQRPLIQAYHICFTGGSLSFMTSVFTVLSAISLDKVPPLSILTLKNLLKSIY